MFIKDHPDFVLRNEDGTTCVGAEWPFARLNFKNKELREYLYSNMETLISEYKADGFRCDVGDQIPLDFWEETFTKLKKKYPNIITLNEGCNNDYIVNTFDMCYDFGWYTLMTEIFARDESASEIKKTYESKLEYFGENINKLIKTIDTHDSVNDCETNRKEILMTSRGVEATLVVTDTIGGTPFLWNGYEVCDNAEISLFANRFHGKGNWINWSRGFTEDGIRRINFIRIIHGIYKNNEALYAGDVEWIDNCSPDEIVSYVKKTDNQKLFIAVNTKNKPMKAKINIDNSFKNILMESGVKMGEHTEFEPYGYFIAQI